MIDGDIEESLYDGIIGIKDGRGVINGTNNDNPYICMLGISAAMVVGTLDDLKRPFSGFFITLAVEFEGINEVDLDGAILLIE